MEIRCVVQDIIQIARQQDEHCLLSVLCSLIVLCIKNTRKGNLFQKDTDYFPGVVESVNSRLVFICSRIFLLIWNLKVHHSHYKSPTTEPIMRQYRPVLLATIRTFLRILPSDLLNLAQFQNSVSFHFVF